MSTITAPEIPLTFCNVKKLILAAADQLGVPLSNNRAKSLAALFLTQPGKDDPDSYLRLTYTDDTGELAVIRVATQMLARQEAEAHA